MPGRFLGQVQKTSKWFSGCNDEALRKSVQQIIYVHINFRLGIRVKRLDLGFASPVCVSFVMIVINCLCFYYCRII